MTKIHRFFFFLTILFLPAQLGRHFWPEWVFILGRRVDYLSPTVYLTDILILLTIFFWLLANKFSIFNFQFSIKRRNFQFSIFVILLLCLFIGLNLFFAENKPIAIYFWLKVLEFTMFGYYIVKTKPKASDVTLGLSVAIFYSSVIAIIQFFLQHSIGGPLWFLGERTFSSQTPGIAQINVCINQCRLLLRPYATFPHPNVLGGFLAITVPLLIFNFKFLIFNQTKKIQIFKLTTIALGMIALILTFSRSAWLVGALGIGWIFIPKKLKTLYTFCSVATFLVGIFLVKDFAGTSESVIVREQLNSSTISLWNHSPLFGIGLGNFLTELPRILPVRTIYFLQPVHNIYLLILSETGIVGFGIFFFLIISVVNKIRNSSIIIHNSFFMILLLGLIDHYPITLQQGQLLFTLFLAFSLI